MQPRETFHSQQRAALTPVTHSMDPCGTSDFEARSVWPRMQAQRSLTCTPLETPGVPGGGRRSPLPRPGMKGGPRPLPHHHRYSGLVDL